MTPHTKDRIARVVVAVLCASIVFTGIPPLLRGDLFYRNYWGGLVLGPLAVVIGLAGLFLVVFYWRPLNERGSDTPKLKGRAARKARQAERYRAPIDDFDEPWGGSGG